MSRQETGPKAEQLEDRRSNRTRPNNKKADTKKMQSNDSPEIQDRDQISEASGRPPSGPK